MPLTAVWMPGPEMLAASVGLPPLALPGPDARMFVEQAVLAVRHSRCSCAVWSGLNSVIIPKRLLWCTSACSARHRCRPRTQSAHGLFWQHQLLCKRFEAEPW